MPSPFLNAMEFVGQPDLGIPKLHVGYEWEYCQGTRKPFDLKAQDSRRVFGHLPAGAYRAIDLEPGSAYPAFMLLNPFATDNPISDGVAFDRDIGQARELIFGARRSFLDKVEFYNSYARNVYHLDRAREINFARMDAGLWDGLDVLSLDVYRFEPVEDEACDLSLEVILKEARVMARLQSKRLHVWVSTHRHIGGPLHPAILRADLVRVVRNIDVAAGDRVVLWSARAAEIEPGRWDSLPWDENSQIRTMLWAIEAMG